MKCPNCKHDTLEVKTGNYTEGKHTIYNTQWEECFHCGEKYFGPEILEGLTKAYYVNNDLILPEEIKQRRKDCRKTQQELADAIGVSENSIKRWEKGSYIQPEDKNARMEEVFLKWQEEKLTKLSVESWINSLMDRAYTPKQAFAVNTIGNTCKEQESDIKALINKIKK